MQQETIVQISKDEVWWLLSNLNEPNVAHVSFRSMVERFSPYKHGSNKLFSLGVCMIELLHRCELFPGRCQRLMAAVMLYQLFRNGNKLSGSIFSNYLCEIIDIESKPAKLEGIRRLEPNDIGFLVHLMNGTIEMGNLTPNMITTTYSVHDFRSILPKVLAELTDTGEIDGIFQDKMRFPLLWALSAEQNEPIPQNKETFSFTVELIAIVANMSSESLKPTMIRPPPPPMEGNLIEIPWHFSSAKHLLPPFHGKIRPTTVWPIEGTLRRPKTNYFRHAHYSILSRLLTQAHVSVDELTLLVEMIISVENEPHLLCYIASVNSDVFAQLVGASTPATITLIVAVSGTSFVNVVLTMLTDISTFRSIEVVKELINNSGNLICADFVHKFILNFMKNTSSYSEDNSDCRLRWIRILCAFITSIVKQKVFELRPILTQIQSFCCEFTKMKEATALYKLLRNRED